ncbi:MAG: hypothetical protein RIB03_11965 [Henriciella sp.]|uniref:hypothetical protein n=1 Tax=Henriciella sp. TaxID=1968823 RepID=UPI0032EFB671
MNWKQTVLASASTLFLLSACGDSDPAEQTPASEAPMESDAALPEEQDAAGDMSGTSMTDDASMNDDASTDEVSPLVDDLEGDWVSGEDDRSEMSIIDGSVTMMYDGKVLSTETLQSVETCPDVPGDAADMELITMTSTDTGETLCYGILSLSEDRLELTSYPKGNTITYTRQPMTGLD